VQQLTRETIARKRALEEMGIGSSSAAPPFANPPADFHFRNPTLGVDEEEYRRLVDLQRHREGSALEEAAQRYRREVADTISRDGGAMLPPARKLLSGWFHPLSKAIEHERAECMHVLKGEEHLTHAYDRSNYCWYLPLLDVDKLTVLTMHTLMSKLLRPGSYKKPGDRDGEDNSKHISSSFTKTITIADALGTNVQSQVHCAPERNLQSAVESFGQYVTQDWGKLIRQKIGAVLIVTALNNLTVRVPDGEGNEDAMEVPAILCGKINKYGDGVQERNMYGRHSEPGVGSQLPDQEQLFDDGSARGSKTHYSGLRLHPSVSIRLDHELGLLETFDPKHMPMVVPPRPWRSFTEGGYLSFNSVVIRGTFSSLGPAKNQLRELYEVENAALANKGTSFDSVLEALNVLGATPWVVHKRVHDTMEALWREGGNVAKLPNRANEPLPERPLKRFSPSFGSAYAMKLTYRVPKNVERQYQRELKRVKTRNNERQSLRCDMEYKLNVARMLRDERCFYYPHSVDFRGRAYPIHPHLHHLGPDPSRGLLTFARTQQLGRDGFQWLKVQLSSMYGQGIDKKPISEKVQFVDNNLGNIYDSARHPLEGSRWWLDAEDPWQCLATCMEIVNALDSGDPESFESSLPVHQDGSCNGLQHYAALGRDEYGAQSVNMLPSEQPFDVYSDVAEHVRSELEKDLNSSTSAETQRMAQALLPHVDRKLVKQTVMTTVYGITFYGAKQQIRSRLKERDALTGESEEFKRSISHYATQKTFGALNNTFSCAREVMQWLTSCAAVISNHNHAVKWRTPLGLPVVQPYVKTMNRKVNTLLQRFHVRVDASTDPSTKVEGRKQKSAFPPNYIHSLDSSHMMMTALEMHKRGLVFAGVHDSFWTHAGSVSEMGDVLRDQFVELHSQPLLEQLYYSFIYYYPSLTHEFPRPPVSGSLDVQQVKDSEFFFS
jgi:DNA-directed RNA polymerase